MRFIYTLLLLFTIAAIGHSQHERLYTLYVFNKLQYNPAYAGAKEALNIGAHYRHQWQGVNGAPRTISAFAHAPFAKGRSGIGFSLISDEIGMFNTTKGKIDYAYRIGFKNDTKLSLGLNMEFENSRFDWSKANLIDNQDTAIPFGETGNSAFNVGMGLYYTGPKFYVGAAVPNFMKNAITSDNYLGFGNYNEFRTYYLMGGLVLPVGSQVHIRPSLLVSYVQNAPFEIDFNLSILFLESIWVGTSYRLHESIDAFVQFPITKQLKLAVGVDYAVTKLNKFTRGSGEIMLEYLFKYDNDRVNNIRYF